MTRKQKVVDEGICAEFEQVCLGDARLDERLKRIASLVAVAPSDSFPDQMGSVADREALYRFFANPKVTLDRVLAGHIEQTHGRMVGRRQVRIVHDTTTFRFDGEREGLGVLRHDAKGFLGHFALAVSADESREPLGVLAVRPYIHQDAVGHRGMTRAKRVKASRSKPRADKESSRWEKLALEVSTALPEGVLAVHVMDQEADDYDLLAAMHQEDLAFVIRADPNRKTAQGALCIKQVVASRPAKVFRTVHVNPRSKHKETVSRGRHPARRERTAELKIQWGAITLPRRQYSDTDAKKLSLWAVYVLETNAPDGEQPIEWMLLTSEPVTTLAQATAVVDHYRARWLIEEYFKALKTGCSFEKRQLTTFDGLVRALAVFVPMAWRLLTLRQLSRDPAPPSATSLFDGEQLLLLRMLLEQRRYALPSKPTVRDAMLGIAALGGHIKNNGDPGWLVLGRGFTRFVEAESIWRLAREQRCDQS